MGEDETDLVTIDVVTRGQAEVIEDPDTGFRKMERLAEVTLP